MICSATPPMLCVYEGVMSIYSEYPVIHVTNFSQHSPKLWDLFRHTLLWVYEGVMSIYSEYPVIHLPNFTLHSPKLCDMFRHTSYEYTRVLRCIFWIFCYPCDELYAAFSKTVWYIPPHLLWVYEGVKVYILNILLSMWRTLRCILQNCMIYSATPPMSIRGC